MDYIKQLDCATRLVRLQMTNQVPLRRLAAHNWNLLFRFLNAVLAKLREPTTNCRLDGLNRMCLADGDESYLIHSAVRAPRGVAHSLAHALNASDERARFVHDGCHQLKSNYNNAARRWLTIALYNQPEQFSPHNP